MTEPFIVAAAQYPIDAPADWDAYAAKITGWVAEAAAAGAALAVFPEYGAMELAALDPATAGDLGGSLASVAARAEAVEALHSGLARTHGIHILAASGPALVPGAGPRGGPRYVNRARLFAPSGAFGWQDKLVMTRFEAEQWFVSPGTALTLFDTALGRIGDLGALRVRLGLDGADVRKVRPGAVVHLSGLNGDALGEGRVSAVEPRIDPQTRLASVLVTLKGHLTPGQPLKGEIALTAADGPAAPRAAVVYEADGASLFVVQKGVAHKRAVKLGPEQADRIAILEGVKAGETVVVDGAAVLEDGMAVREGAAPAADKADGKPDQP